ncbi:MAG: hypothetical protein HQK53_08625 [Oligoflexia bacterium]|nr:hypothetical protein [Oligoflexia bacterium]
MRKILLVFLLFVFVSCGSLVKENKNSSADSSSRNQKLFNIYDDEIRLLILPAQTETRQESDRVESLWQNNNVELLRSFKKLSIIGNEKIKLLCEKLEINYLYDNDPRSFKKDVLEELSAQDSITHVLYFEGIKSKYETVFTPQIYVLATEL